MCCCHRTFHLNVTPSEWNDSLPFLLLAKLSYGNLRFFLNSMLKLTCCSSTFVFISVTFFSKLLGRQPEKRRIHFLKFLFIYFIDFIFYFLNCSLLFFSHYIYFQKHFLFLFSPSPLPSGNH